MGDSTVLTSAMGFHPKGQEPNLTPSGECTGLRLEQVKSSGTRSACNQTEMLGGECSFRGPGGMG